MKVIFLDIDGVLNSRSYDIARDMTMQSAIDVTRLKLVKEIVDSTGAHIVLSSTWRRHWSGKAENCDETGRYINSTFDSCGLQIYDKTPDLGVGAERKDEIAEWLGLHTETTEAFVIIDDNPFGWGELGDNLVKTDPNFHCGLEPEDVSKAIEILNDTH